MATREERLKALEQRQAQIQAQIQAIKAREAGQERKNDTRRKVILGGVVIRLIKDGELREADVRQWLDRLLTAERDRRLFNLSPHSAASTALSPSGMAAGPVSGV